MFNWGERTASSLSHWDVGKIMGLRNKECAVGVFHNGSYSHHWAQVKCLSILGIGEACFIPISVSGNKWLEVFHESIFTVNYCNPLKDLIFLIY